MIEAKLEGLHFFQLSQGSYSDYSVGGLYVCDHEVKVEEWDAYYKGYQDVLDAKRKELITVPYTEREAYSMQCREWVKFHDSLPRPEESFIRLHKMVEVDCTEFWRD